MEEGEIDDSQRRRHRHRHHPTAGGNSRDSGSGKGSSKGSAKRLEMDLDLETAKEAAAAATEAQSPAHPELNKRLPRLYNRINSSKSDGSALSPMKSPAAARSTTALSPQQHQQHKQQYQYDPYYDHRSSSSNTNSHNINTYTNSSSSSSRSGPATMSTPPPTAADVAAVGGPRSFLQSPVGAVAAASAQRGPTRRFSIKDSQLLVPQTAALDPEVEALRSQDIQHDANSAAERALQAINNNNNNNNNNNGYMQQQQLGEMASHSARGASAGAKYSSGGDWDTPASTDTLAAATTTPATTATEERHGSQMMRRRSNSSNNNRSTGRKVEGREIQQDHEQYALTYGMMLGIRVMTGRRDQELEVAKDAQFADSDDRGSSSKANSNGNGNGNGNVSNSNSSGNFGAAESPAAAAATSKGLPRTNTLDMGLSPASTIRKNGINSSSYNNSSSSIRKNDSSYNRLNYADMAESARERIGHRFLADEDFDCTLELSFDPKGTPGPPLPTPPHKLNFTFKFKDYMWNVFRVIRALSGIDEAEYMMSLAGDFNYIEFIANSKSGQFFFYSHDGHYMIKTQSKEECGLLRRIMPRYVHHLTHNPNSLLVRFYGMHRVKFKSQTIYFVIMSSVFSTEKPIHVKYDLKGSTRGRETDAEDCRNGAVQKDLNLMNSGRKIRLGAERIDLFVETLRSDAYFLRDLNVMDYSLLVGVHDTRVNNGRQERRRSSGVVLTQQQQQRASLVQQRQQQSQRLHFTSTSGNNSNSNKSQELSPPRSPLSRAFSSNYQLDCDPTTTTATAAAIAVGDYDANAASVFQAHHGGICSDERTGEIYFFGIIDILQLWDLRKKSEATMKGMFTDRHSLSAVPPDQYAARMVSFILQHTDYDEILHERRRQQQWEQQQQDGNDSNTTVAAASANASGKESKSPKLSSVFKFGKKKKK